VKPVRGNPGFSRWRIARHSIEQKDQIDQVGCDLFTHHDRKWPRRICKFFSALDRHRSQEYKDPGEEDKSRR